ELCKAVYDKAYVLIRKDVMDDVDTIRDAAEAAWNGSARAFTQAKRCYVRLLEACDRTELGTMERELRALRDHSKRIEFERRPERLEVADMIARSEPLVVRCRTRVELAKIALAVSGPVI